MKKHFTVFTELVEYPTAPGRLYWRTGWTRGKGGGVNLYNTYQEAIEQINRLARFLEASYRIDWAEEKHANDIPKPFKPFPISGKKRL